MQLPSIMPSIQAGLAYEDPGDSILATSGFYHCCWASAWPRKCAEETAQKKGPFAQNFRDYLRLGRIKVVEALGGFCFRVLLS